MSPPTCCCTTSRRSNDPFYATPVRGSMVPPKAFGKGVFMVPPIPHHGYVEQERLESDRRKMELESIIHNYKNQYGSQSASLQRHSSIVSALSKDSEDARTGHWELIVTIVVRHWFVSCLRRARTSLNDKSWHAVSGCNAVSPLCLTSALAGGAQFASAQGVLGLFNVSCLSNAAPPHPLSECSLSMSGNLPGVVYCLKLCLKLCFVRLVASSLNHDR